MNKYERKKINKYIAKKIEFLYDYIQSTKYIYTDEKYKDCREINKYNILSYLNELCSLCIFVNNITHNSLCVEVIEQRYNTTTEDFLKYKLPDLYLYGLQILGKQKTV